MAHEAESIESFCRVEYVVELLRLSKDVFFALARRNLYVLATICNKDINLACLHGLQDQQFCRIAESNVARYSLNC